jgi:hypothetical protein
MRTANIRICSKLKKVVGVTILEKEGNGRIGYLMGFIKTVKAMKELNMEW